MPTYELTTLSPVHVGTGTTLMHFDAVYAGESWHRIDLDRILTRPNVDAQALARDMGQSHFRWSNWLDKVQIPLGEVCAYSLPCPQDPQEVGVREAIKDAYGRPYLPGSSLKGAVRTALLWYLLCHNDSHRRFARQYLDLCVYAQKLHRHLSEKRAFDRSDVQRDVIAEVLDLEDREAESYQRTLYRACGVREDRLSDQREWQRLKRTLQNLGGRWEWVAQTIEHQVFGRDPNHDLLRALQVSDSEPAGLEALEVGLVWTYQPGSGGRLVEKVEAEGEYKNFTEQFRVGTMLRLALRVDKFLFSSAAERELHFRGERQQAVERLADVCNAFAAAVIAHERQFYADHSCPALADFYADLEAMRAALPPGAFLLCVGWGGGYETKTVTDLLMQQGGLEMMDVRQHYQLGQSRRTGQYHALFPKTRRIGYDGGAPAWALGWVQVCPT
jgi:CRISPR type III-A-associated RAMP protein Csm5